MGPGGLNRFAAFAAVCLTLACGGGGRDERQGTIPKATPPESRSGTTAGHEHALPPMPQAFGFAACELESLVPAPPALQPVTSEVRKYVQPRIDRLAASDCPDRRGPTADIVALGSQGVAALAEILDGRRCVGRRRQRVDFCMGSGSYDAPCCGDRIAAAEVLEQLGENAAAAVPALLRATEGTPCNLRVPEGVVTCDSPLGNLLPRAATAALARMGPYGAAAFADGPGFERLSPSADAVPFLLRALARDATRCDVVEGLGWVEPAPVEAIPALIAQLGGPCNDDAAQALTYYGPLAFDAASKLAQPLLHLPNATWDDDNPYRSIEALAAIGPEATEAVPALVEFAKRALRDERPYVRNSGKSALDALAKIGPTTPSAAAFIVSSLDDPDHEVRMSATRAIGRLGAAGLPLIARLPIDSGDGLEALGLLGKTAPDRVVPLLVPLLADRPGGWRADAARALGEIGAAAEQAVPRLVEMLGPLGQNAVAAAVVEDCSDYASGECNADVVAHAAEALGRIGRRGDLVVPRLVELASLDVPDGKYPEAYRIKLGAMEALGSFPEHAERSVPVLLGSLASFPRVVAPTLARLGPAAKAALPQLSELAKRGDEDAQRAIPKVAGTDAASKWTDVAYLEGVLRDGDDAARRRARLEVRKLMIARLQCPSSL